MQAIAASSDRVQQGGTLQDKLPSSTCAKARSTDGVARSIDEEILHGSQDRNEVNGEGARLQLDEGVDVNKGMPNAGNFEVNRYQRRRAVRRGTKDTWDGA